MFLLRNTKLASYHQNTNFVTFTFLLQNADLVMFVFLLQLANLITSKKMIFAFQSKDANFICLKMTSASRHPEAVQTLPRMTFAFCSLGAKFTLLSMILGLQDKMTFTSPSLDMRFTFLSMTLMLRYRRPSLYI
jgi:hypothetical protein